MGVFTHFPHLAEAAAVGGEGQTGGAPAARRFVLTCILIFVSGLLSLTDAGEPAARRFISQKSAFTYNGRPSQGGT